jgi:hypothetical protein
MTNDLACPSCGDGRVRRLPKNGHREDYVCPVCFAFSVSGSDWPAIKAGARSGLVLEGELVWLRPVASATGGAPPAPSRCTRSTLR